MLTYVKSSLLVVDMSLRKAKIQKADTNRVTVQYASCVR
jgi:hypothetical protein